MSLRCILVGEAWGEREARFQHAFVGPSGAELARLLAQAQLAGALNVRYPSELDMIAYWRRLRETHGIGLANVFNTRPPNNEIETFFSREGVRDLPPLKPGKYIRQEYLSHVHSLWELVQREAPNLIIAFGNTACWALLAQTKIGELRGTLHASPNLGAKVLPTYHPAAIMRNWSLRPIVLADLTKASREIEFPEIRRPERWITAHDHRDGTRITLSEIAQWLAQPASVYAVDIESGYALYAKNELAHMTSQMRYTLSNQISMVGFASSPSRALVIPIMDRAATNLTYWPDASDEAQAWAYIRQGLTTPVPKIFQNGLYDIGRFLAMGVVPTRCEEDTMLRHHSLYPELLKSLGFLGSIYANEISWKQMYKNRESLKRDE